MSGPKKLKRARHVERACVESAHIGETEKNLSAAFSETEHADAQLLIDEADALFGKRTEAKDPHDRFAGEAKRSSDG